MKSQRPNSQIFLGKFLKICITLKALFFVNLANKTPNLTFFQLPIDTKKHVFIFILKIKKQDI